MLKPMDSTNKPLDTIEKEVYRKKSRITIFISIILYYIFHFKNLPGMLGHKYCLCKRRYITYSWFY